MDYAPMQALLLKALLLMILFCSYHSIVVAQDQHWLRQNQRGMQAMSQGDFDAAEKALATAITRAEALDDGAMELAASLNNLGLVYQQGGRYQEAEEVLRRSLQLRLKIYGRQHRYYAQSLNSLASVLQDIGETAESEKLFKDTLQIYTDLFGNKHPLVADTLNNLGSLHRSTDRLVSAETYLRRALSIQQALFGSKHPRVTTTISNLASLVLARGDEENAEALYRQVIRIRRESKPTDFNGLVIAMNNLGVIFHRQCRLLEANKVLGQAVDIIDEQLSGRHAEFGRIQFRLGLLAIATKQFNAADELLASALETEVKGHGADHQRLLPILDAQADLLNLQSRRQEADQKQLRAVQIRDHYDLPAPTRSRHSDCQSKVV